jgi:hypothetical protein
MFPDIIGSDLEDKTLRVETHNHMGRGYSNRYIKALRPPAVFHCTWEGLEQLDRDAISSFIQGQAGGRFSFFWLHWFVIPHRFVKIGIGDGSRTLFDIPGVRTLDQQFFADGTALLNGNIIPGAGTDGRDQVALFAPPAIDVVVLASFTGRRFYTMTFNPDSQLKLPRLLDADRSVYSFECEFSEAKGDQWHL